MEKDGRDKSGPVGDGFVPITPVLVFVGTDQLEVGTLDIAAIHVRDLRDYVLNLPPRLKESEVAVLITLFKAPNNPA